MPAVGQTSFQQQVLSYNKNTKKKISQLFSSPFLPAKNSLLFIFYLFGEKRLVFI